MFDYSQSDLPNPNNSLANGQFLIQAKSIFINDVAQYNYYYEYGGGNQGNSLTSTKIFDANNVLLSTSKIIYSTFGTRKRITEIQASKGASPLEPTAQFVYDTDGNKVQTTQYTPGNPTPAGIESYIYGYDNRFVVAKISGVKYADIEAINGRISAIKTATNFPVSDANDDIIRFKINHLRTDFPNALITTYTYNPVFGMTSVTDPKNYTIYSEYDVFGRLKYTKEKNEAGTGFNILSENQYNTISN
jgi:hypothetical protein